VDVRAISPSSSDTFDAPPPCRWSRRRLAYRSDARRIWSPKEARTSFGVRCRQSTTGRTHCRLSLWTLGVAAIRSSTACAFSMFDSAPRDVLIHGAHTGQPRSC